MTWYGIRIENALVLSSSSAYDSTCDMILKLVTNPANPVTTMTTKTPAVITNNI